MGEDLLAPLRPSIETPDPAPLIRCRGADFTIGGIVASQCGIPLKSISILSGNLTGWALARYLPEPFASAIISRPTAVSQRILQRLKRLVFPG